MFGGKDVWAERERRYDEMERAKRDRLIRQILEHKPVSAGGLQRWANHLGAWLISVGSNLQAGHVAEAR